MGCAIFDLDGTLVGAPSCERRFVRYLLRHRRLGVTQAGAALAFAVRYLPRYGRDIWRKNKAYLAGLTTEEVERLAADFVEAEVAPALRPSMLARIDDHRRGGDVVGLLTGTIDAIAGPVARRLGADAWSSAIPEVEGGHYAARPPRRHPYGADKVPAARALADSLGCPLSEAAVYADSAADRLLLGAAGTAVAVAPDASLRRAAQASRWEIIEA